MKRSHDFHEKISLKRNKKLQLPFEPSGCSSRQLRNAPRNEDEISILSQPSGEPPRAIELEDKIPETATPAKPLLSENSSTAGAESFRTRITAKLKTALDGFVSDLQNIAQSEQSDAASSLNKSTVSKDYCLEKSLFEDNNDNFAARLALQNFIQSAKSQFSELLSKNLKISNENSVPTTKPSNADPFRIQILLKFQDLLCNALDSKRFSNNAANSSETARLETELQDLSHLLQDFLSSAKKKLSSSLSTGSKKQAVPNTRSSICIANSTSDEIQLLQSFVLDKSWQKGTPDKQRLRNYVKNRELNKRQILQLSDTETRSIQSSNNSLSQSPIGSKASQSKESDKQIQENKNEHVLNKKRISKGNTSVKPTSGQIKKNQLFQPLNHNKSCQDKGSDKQCCNKLLDKNCIQESQSNITAKSTRSRIDKIQPSQPLNPNKTCHTKELRRLDSKLKPDLKISERNLPSQSTDCSSKTMESYYESNSSSGDGPNESAYMNGGILLLSECERTPDFLDLNLEVHDSDVDDPEFENTEFIHSGYGDRDSDSDEDVVVLGEKRPTYQEITLDEDDDGEVYEKVIEMEKPSKLPKNLQALLYDCPKCDKKFRVESLLKFHIRMHSVVESHGRVASPSSFVATVPDATSDGDCVSGSEKTPRKSKSRHARKEKENNKVNSKSSHKHKNHRGKNGKRKSKMSP